ncbi:hypothetical protein F2Q69_00058499 [Brassica cretica]|uniref:Uncharacterized protein n=1 Tax=Brassica cretica TaxID=69181 RepID=A0A8S9RLH2_BRACR|nr:hypothetical protein F2Q69_00058499 [Brassica cretica]
MPSAPEPVLDPPGSVSTQSAPQPRSSQFSSRPSCSSIYPFQGGIAGCSSADFAFANTSVPQPPPQPADVGFPLTARQLQRKWRNPAIEPSTSGNKSPSLASSDNEVEIDEVQSQPWFGGYSSAPGGYYTTFRPDDDDAGATPTHYP